MQNFDPTSDSITYLFLLRLQIQTLQEASRDALPKDLLPSGAVWSRAAHYLELFDSVQVRYAGLEWRQLVEFVGRAAQVTSQVNIRPPRSVFIAMILTLSSHCSPFDQYVRQCYDSIHLGRSSRRLTFF